MEDGRNPESRTSTFGENPKSRHKSFDNCEYQLRDGMHSHHFAENLDIFPNAFHSNVFPLENGINRFFKSKI
jgi:hypothetical protein